MDQSNHSRQRCYSVLDPKRIQLVIRSKETSAALPAELVEISPTSAVVLLSSPPTLSGACELSLATSKLKQPLVFVVRVDWMRPNAAGQWQLGCAIEPPLAAAAFKKLLSSGVLERRETPREPVNIAVHVQLDPGKPRIPAIVRNISEGGLCCLATNCPPHESRLVSMFVVEAGQEVRMPLKVRWSTRAGSDYFLGCQFVRQSDFAVLRRKQFGVSEGDELALAAPAERHGVS